MDIRQIPFTAPDGTEKTLADFGDKAVMVVNVASKCGLTPQYEKLEQLQKEYGDRGFTVVGFPCNQFLGQEPGTSEEIQEFCSTTYGVTFPLMEKTKVNGVHKSPLYAALTREPDAEGKAGRVSWNFEKFLVAPDGSVSRFRPRTEPDAPEVIEAIEKALPAASTQDAAETPQA